MKDEIKKELEMLSVEFNSAVKKIYAQLDEQPKEVKKWEAPVGLNVKFTGDDMPDEYLVGLHKHLEKQSILYQLAHELNDGWVPDWEDDEYKYSIYYNYERKKWCSSAYSVCQVSSPVFNFDAKNKSLARLNANEVEGV